MAWTTRKVYIDNITAEVLEEIQRRGYTIVKKEVIYHKINDTHTERIIIYGCEKSRQIELYGDQEGRGKK